MKKDMPLEGLRWSRDSGSALYDTPQNGRSRTGWGGVVTKTLSHLIFFKYCLRANSILCRNFATANFEKN